MVLLLPIYNWFLVIGLNENNMPLTLADTEALDLVDPLKNAKSEFSIPENTIYLNSNSLGVMPKAVPERIQDFTTREWSNDLIGSWNHNKWFEAPYRIGDKIARIIGVSDSEVVATDCASINLYKLVVAALNARPGRTRIVTEAGNFPTDLYMLQSVAESFAGDVEIVAVQDRNKIIEEIDERTALVVLTDVHYKTSHLLDRKAITERTHQHGALILWDLCHSAGALPVDLNELEADLAVGCTYKYLSGGPGAPGFIFVAKHLQNQLTQPLQGWWGHAEPFKFVDDYAPTEGIGRFLCSTQSVLALTAMEVGIDVFLKYEMKDIRRKSQKLGQLFIELIEERCAGFQFTIASPRDPEQRGSHVALAHDNAYAIMQALIKHKVIGDFRAPDTIRFGFSPLYMSYADIWNAVTILEEVMQTAQWDRKEFQIVNSVT